MKNKINGMNVLVCGSQKFEDQNFVFSTLDTFYTSSKGNLRRIFTSKFSGACEFARSWAEQKNASIPKDQHIDVVDYAFDMALEKKNQSFYEEVNIPAYALQNDPFFKSGKELLISKGVSIVMCFPNQEGKLGASTHNIQRFANLADIPVFDCSQLLSLITQYKEEQAVAPKEESNNSSVGFNNRHPGRR